MRKEPPAPGSSPGRRSTFTSKAFHGSNASSPTTISAIDARPTLPRSSRRCTPNTYSSSRIVPGRTARSSAITAPCKAKEDQLAKALASAGRRNPIQMLAGAKDLRSLWFGTDGARSDGLTLGQRRAILDVLMTVTILRRRAPAVDSSPSTSASSGRRTDGGAGPHRVDAPTVRRRRGPRRRDPIGMAATRPRRPGAEGDRAPLRLRQMRADHYRNPVGRQPDCARSRLQALAWNEPRSVGGRRSAAQHVGRQTALAVAHVRRERTRRSGPASRLRRRVPARIPPKLPR